MSKQSQDFPLEEGNVLLTEAIDLIKNKCFILYSRMKGNFHSRHYLSKDPWVITAAREVTAKSPQNK